MNKYLLRTINDNEFIDLEAALADLGYRPHEPSAEPETQKWSLEYKQMQADLLEKCRAEIVMLKKELAEWQNENNPLRAEIDMLGKEIVRLRAIELTLPQTLKDTFDQMKVSISEAGNHIDQLNAVIAEQEKELNRLRVELLRASETNVNLQKASDQWRAIVDEAQKERINTAVQEAFWRNKADELQKKLWAMEAALHPPEDDDDDDDRLTLDDIEGPSDE